MAVGAFKDDGTEITNGDAGELLCVLPFPSQPVTFYGPGGMEKYKASYFETFRDRWHHGDYVRVNWAQKGD